jgi:DNA mismatch repair protein MutS
VARLAGLPTSVIARARTILGNLEGGEFDERGRPRLAGGTADAVADAGQLGLFGSGAVALRPGEARALEALRGIDPNRMTPLEALERLAELVAAVRVESDA